MTYAEIALIWCKPKGNEISAAEVQRLGDEYRRKQERLNSGEYWDESI